MRNLIAILLSVVFLALLTTPTIGQSYFGPKFDCDHQSCGLKADPEDKFTFVPPHEGFEYGQSRDAVISVTYNGFSASAQNAFQYAVDIWASYLESSVPITITANWQNIGGTVLGFAGANDYEINFSGAPFPNTWYPAALANKLAGTDLNPGTSDISCTFNSSTNWYLGTNGNTPSGQYDFVSVVLHELGHGLGSIGGSSESNGVGTYGFSGTPVIWDRFIENNSAQNLTTFGSPSTALGGQLRGNNLHWDGEFGVSELNGVRPRIYAPSTWDDGSSYSHLNESSYGFGNENSLMTPFIGAAEAIHDPGPAMLGMFEDMGWSIFPSCRFTNVSLVSSTPCNPATGNFDMTISIAYENPPENNQMFINGLVYDITSNPQEFSFTYEANRQIVDFDIRFSIDQNCRIMTNNFFIAPASCCGKFKLTEVNPETKQFTIVNNGACSENLASYRVFSEGNSSLLFFLTRITGGLILESGESTTFQWDDWTPDALGSDLALVIPFLNPTTPSNLEDYVQWKNAGNEYEAIAVQAGYWTAGEFVADFAPYTFNGGENDFGAQFWEGAPAPCGITSLTAGSSTGCNASTLTYNQEIIVAYEFVPETGSLTVNGINFPIQSSPQTVELTGLISDGMSVGVTASFTVDNTCTLTTPNVFTAPESCACAFDYNSNGLVAIEDLTMLLSTFGCNSGCFTDLSGNDAITTDDLTIFLQNFGTLCTP